MEVYLGHVWCKERIMWRLGDDAWIIGSASADHSHVENHSSAEW
jgi:hypothetical protein